ncbi:undecaprenyl-diphosphate phosphatase [Oceanibacterium hippocampi]|uniref:Undecaprenyl-diphosphatase n=1 Tax=Oceanibacterium hippocampi TaxID=745714 RepID=A0A1Y5RSG3_9PROT|nr:undecaprenyl-diphosphate phosphatase [Oceanibacterium hippocampi]SLN23301.1 Undecaprenyl-diphosphatase [Oceanibacterium hippocampi]
MTPLQIIVLAVVQGVTEFLPISSSGHLALIGTLGTWPDQGLLIDVAVHVGTLGAVLLYFWRDLWWLLTGLGALMRGRYTEPARILVYLAIGTVPVVIAGFLVVKLDLEPMLRRPDVIAWATIGFGVLLYLADKSSLTLKRMEHMTFGTGLMIGASQILALIPGTSRSGITMTAARFAGFERQDAARFSMLLSIPTVLGAGLLGGLELHDQGNLQIAGDAVLVAALSFLTALGAIWLLMRWLRNASFTPFVIYRLGLGILLLYWLYA